jgi:glycosyltransferase involved in cell wall biosynthesis
MEQKISVVINTYNAEQHLEQVLEAVRDFDEIVVCDMESTDNTLDIARKYGCKIVTFAKKNYNIVEPARNFAVQSAQNKWVLVVDADEIITPELKSILYKKINEPNCPAGFFIQRRNMFMGMYIRDFHPEYILRFFIKDGAEWPPYIHSIPVIQGRVEKLKGYDNACMLHLMDETMYEYMAKMNQYTDNEVEKKRGRNYGVGALIWRPIWRFFKKYFMDGSYRMGTRGLIRAMMAAVYQFVLISKIIEKRYRD